MRNRLLHGNYVADFYLSDSDPFPVYHYIITAQDSRRILFWGQCISHEQAEHDALETMRSMNGLPDQEAAVVSFPEPPLERTGS
jgi:hypothetical protein